MLVRDAYYSETVLNPDEDGVDLGWVARDADRGDGHLNVVYDLEIAGSELEGIDVSGLGVKLTLSPDELKEKYGDQLNGRSVDGYTYLPKESDVWEYHRKILALVEA
jgi:hypothetical protein